MGETPVRLSGDNRAPIFGLDEEQQAILDQADRFAHKELYPLCERMDRDEWWPEAAFPKIGDNGFFGVTIPEEYGGSGQDLLAAGLVLQGFARWNHAMALSWRAHDNLCGSKIYITNGPVADVLLVYAKTDRVKGAHGISAFIIEKDFPGFKVAQKLTKMGYRGSQTAELVFEDCRVPAENLVGEDNSGVSIVMSGLDLERAMISPLCLGISERALQLSIDYAQTRQQFGKPIGCFQMVQSMLAEMYVQVETMRTFTYRTLAEAAPLEVGGGGRGDIHMLTAASVMYAAEACHAVLDKAVQIHGGSGYIWESEINRLFRSIKLLEIGAGTTEVRKMIIAGELLKDMAPHG